jgi:hypothetical protein
MRRAISGLAVIILAVSMAVPADALVRRKRGNTPGAADVTGAAGAGGSGLIVLVSGDVNVHGRWQAARAWEGFALAAGDSITLAAGARVMGFTPSGEPFDYEGPGAHTFTAANPKFRNRVYDYTRDRIAAWPGLGELDPFGTPATYDWEAVATEATPMIPADGGTVRPTQSRFWWQAIEGIRKYEVEISWDDDGRTRRKRYTVSDANRLFLEDLEPGRSYEWLVRTKDGKRLESDRHAFRVLTHNEVATLEDITYGLPEVMAGALMLTAGLHEEAIQYFDAALTVSDYRRSTLVWRSRSFGAVGRYDAAYRDLLDAHVNDRVEKDTFSSGRQEDDGVIRMEPDPFASPPVEAEPRP